jgi:uncharacterized membrane protein YphA (DoxX/SURF4 family)
MKNRFFPLLFGSSAPGSLFFDVTYLLFRLYCGISIALGAGLSKVFHKINEDGPDEAANRAFGVGDWFVQQVAEIGFTWPTPGFWAYVAVYGEFIGGIFVALGFLTRISAAQLAFQFFIVSFVWYNEPEFFGMYYQQLIFWSFMVITGIGGSRFSVDQLISSRKS